MSKYTVPWIFKWQYSLSNDIVSHQHFVKWWDAFKAHCIIKQVQQEFPVNIHAPTPAMVKSQQNPNVSVT